MLLNFVQWREKKIHPYQNDENAINFGSNHICNYGKEVLDNNSSENISVINKVDKSETNCRQILYTPIAPISKNVRSTVFYEKIPCLSYDQQKEQSKCILNTINVSDAHGHCQSSQK